MTSIFKEGRDAEGRMEVEIGMNSMLVQTMAIAVPLVFLGAAYFTMGQGPLGLPWFLIAGYIALAAIAYLVSIWMCKGSRVRVTVDSNAGNLLVTTSAGQSGIRIADVAKAEFGAVLTSKGRRVYRLEFVLRNGERVPATASYFNVAVYGLGAQAKTIAAP